MKKKTILKKLHTPISPILSTIVIIGVVFSAVILMLDTGNNSPKQPITLSSTPTPTLSLTPSIPVDVSTWKTWTDWKYGYSVKFPPEFASVTPGKGYTGNTIDPQGNGFVQFEDTTLSGDYPNRTSKYGFNVQLAIASNQAEQCTTDQECFSLLRNFYHNTPSGMRVIPIHTQILNRDIHGLAIQTTSDNSSSPTGKDISLNYFYNVAVNGKRFSCVVNFYYPKSFQQSQAKDPIINAILSSIFFPNQ